MAGPIYTRRGDQGETQHPDGTRVAKDHPDLQLLGTLDELNAHLGVCAAQVAPLAEPCASKVCAALRAAQRELFALSAGLFAGAGASELAMATRDLEQTIDGLSGRLPALAHFILPGGHPAAAALHVARTVCRRTERQLVAAMRPSDARTKSGAYLNRLADLLFVAARAVNHATGHADEPAAAG